MNDQARYLMDGLHTLLNAGYSVNFLGDSHLTITDQQTQRIWTFDYCADSRCPGLDFKDCVTKVLLTR